MDFRESVLTVGSLRQCFLQWMGGRDTRGGLGDKAKRGCGKVLRGSWPHPEAEFPGSWRYGERKGSY